MSREFVCNVARGQPYRACTVYNLAEANGEEEGAKIRDALPKQMTPAQIAEAQKLVLEWRPRDK